MGLKSLVLKMSQKGLRNFGLKNISVFVSMKIFVSSLSASPAQENPHLLCAGYGMAHSLMLLTTGDIIISSIFLFFFF